MKIKTFLMAICLTFLASGNAVAFTQRQKIFVNQDVTTLIMMPENIKLVDISTERVVGDQCSDNMLRIKPIPDSLMMAGAVPNGAFLGGLTLIGERHMIQYDLLYSENPMMSNTLVEVMYNDTKNYSNPEVPMTEGEMANFAWAISNSGRKFNTVREKKYGIEAQVYNIYSMGGFFFLDIVLNNRTNIPYSIEQMRVTLSDKKETKATNSQSIELTPSYVLNKETSFKKHYRQVLVLPKLTYPEEKVLTVSITEDPISGRVISIPIQYEDILHADAFNGDKEEAYTKTRAVNEDLNKQVNRLLKKIEKQQKELDRANLEIKELNGTIVKKSNQYVTIRKKMEALLKLNRKLNKLKDEFGVSLAEFDIENEDTDAPSQDYLMTLDEI